MVLATSLGDASERRMRSWTISGKPSKLENWDILAGIGPANGQIKPLVLPGSSKAWRGYSNVQRIALHRFELSVGVPVE